MGYAPGILQTLPGYDLMEEEPHGRSLMEKLGYGSNNRLKIRCRRATCRICGTRR